jgi:tetratricopeptide (TPR) repeat protein
LKKGNLSVQTIASTNSPLAFKYLIYGMNANGKSDYPTAINWFKRALAVDSTFSAALGWITAAYINAANKNAALYRDAKKWCLKNYQKRDIQGLKERIMTDYYYSLLFGTPYESIKYLNQCLEMDDQQPEIIYLIGNRYFHIYQYDKAIPEYEKMLKIYDKWNLKVPGLWRYGNLIDAYYRTGQYKKEKRLLKKAEEYYPNDPDMIQRHAVLSLREQDTVAANRYIKKYESILRGNSLSEETIMGWHVWTYREAGGLGKAELYLRKLLALQPANPARLYGLAKFLIENDRNVKEGMELIEKALKFYPDYYSFIDCKGWGLYKQGKKEEALKFLEKSDSLKPVYNHDIYLHIEEVKKSLSEKK